MERQQARLGRLELTRMQTPMSKAIVFNIHGQPGSVHWIIQAHVKVFRYKEWAHKEAHLAKYAKQKE